MGEHGDHFDPGYIAKTNQTEQNSPELLVIDTVSKLYAAKPEEAGAIVDQLFSAAKQLPLSAEKQKNLTTEEVKAGARLPSDARDLEISHTIIEHLAKLQSGQVTKQSELDDLLKHIDQASYVKTSAIREVFPDTRLKSSTANQLAWENIVDRVCDLIVQASQTNVAWRQKAQRIFELNYIHNSRAINEPAITNILMDAERALILGLVRRHHKLEQQDHDQAQAAK
ncbi:TPA: hypothetical protein DEP96_00045 [Candidatus Uhrbacteria bacterium]|nr:hypothetical protein [Candidatus Uhrbacteria bacterium]